MKAKHRIILLSGALAALLVLATGCGKAAQPGGDGARGPGAQDGFEGTMGFITGVTDSSITVAVMPQGNGGQRPDGSGAPGGSGMPQGSGAPRSSASPGGQRPEGSTTIDTSSWEKKTFTIDSSTKITEGQGDSAKTLTAADLKAGDSVRITERDGAAGTADTISLMNFKTGGAT
jgi:hypothetical protein